MGEAQPQDPPATRFAEPSRNTGGFWQTLPGILTATGSFLAGLAGLTAVLAPHLFAPSSPRAATDQAAAKPPTEAPATVMTASAPDTAAPVAKPPADTPAQPAAAPPAAPAPDPAEPVPPANDRYIAAFASDGFVVLRVEPTIASAEIRRILVGGAVRCGKPKWTANGYRWRRCVDEYGEVGYMADTFLRKVG